MIRSVAVLGAGTMGAQIAAHMANAGIPALVLDLDVRTAREGIERLRTITPDPCFLPDTYERITAGGFDSDLAQLRRCDWIIEAIVERLDLKQALLEKVETHRHPTAIISSNTSGIPIASIAAGRSHEFRRHWLGTHFFNPPRYLHLLEVIPTPETDPADVADVSAFVDHRLGKGVVVAKDAPGFIANRIGVYGAARALEVLAEGRYTIEEIDAMTGPAIGRPKSATFRTMDLAGLDVLAHVAGDLVDRLEREGERRAFTLPPLVGQMVDRGLIGTKAGQGFYRKPRGAAGSAIETLDPTTLTYRASQRATLGALEAAQSIADTGAKIRTLFLGDDRVGEFLRRTLGATLVYAAQLALEIANSIDDVDRAMRWGYGWELGPFELWDAIGAKEIVDACGVTEPPPLIQQLFERHAQPPDVTFRQGRVLPAAADLQILRSAKDRQRVVKRNAGASLVDLGEGVLAVEFHSKMNVIGGDIVEMLTAGVREAAERFVALVIGSDAPNFSAGANLMLLLLEAQEGNWDDIDLMVRGFQAATTGLQRAPVPVVVAPAGLTLGGGCEIALRADRVQAAAESYVGLVEVGVGLVPAGGGTAEMLARSMDQVPPGSSVNPLPYVQRAFETIGFAKVSTSGPDARRLGFFRDVDGITMNRERVMADAKARALARVREGYQPPAARTLLVGGETIAAPLKLGVHLAHRAGRISDHDALIGRHLASILSGGALPHPTRVTERHLLDLEREAFLSLCGERKTLERIQHMLKTGKPLRN